MVKKKTINVSEKTKTIFSHCKSIYQVFKKEEITEEIFLKTILKSFWEKQLKDIKFVIDLGEELEECPK